MQRKLPTSEPDLLAVSVTRHDPLRNGVRFEVQPHGIIARS